METVTLTTPEVTPAITTTDYRVVYEMKDVEQKLFVVHVRGTNGERKEFRYSGDDALTFIIFLNKANLTVKSEQRRILERLIADGKLSGAVTGTPD